VLARESGFDPVEQGAVDGARHLRVPAIARRDAHVPRRCTLAVQALEMEDRKRELFVAAHAAPRTLEQRVAHELVRQHDRDRDAVALPRRSRGMQRRERAGPRFLAECPIGVDRPFGHDLRPERAAQPHPRHCVRRQRHEQPVT
jgi:hypothetical protein